MEEAPPIICETDKPKEVDNEINFIEEIKFKQDNEEYNIKFGSKENDLIIKVVSESLKEIIHYQKYISLYNIQKIPLFSGYNNVNDIIKVLKGLKFEIEKKNNEITIFFFFYMPNGKSKFFRYNLPRYKLNDREMAKYAFEEIISIKINMKNEEEKYNKEKIKNENEIKKLKEDISKAEAKISKLELDNKNYKDENEKLRKEIDQIKSNNNKEPKLNNENSINIDNSQGQINENMNLQNINQNQQYQQNDNNDNINEDNINNYNDINNNDINNDMNNNNFNNFNNINNDYSSLPFSSKKNNNVNQRNPQMNPYEKPKEIVYSFKILERNPEIYTKIISSENEIVNLEFTIINKSTNSFPGNTKLVFFKNNITNIKEYYLRSLKPGQKEKININFPENLFFGRLNYIIVDLEVEGKPLRNPTTFTVINKSLAINEFRKEYNLKVDNYYSDENIINALKDNGCNFQFAYSVLISRINNQINQFNKKQKNQLEPYMFFENI